MCNIMLVKRMYTKQYRTHDRDRVRFCELALFGDALKKLTTHCELKREIVLGARLEPLVELDLEW